MTAAAATTNGRRLVVGLTGGIGSGKSAAADCFAELGIEVIDADRISREVVEPGSEALAEIARHFGEGVLLADGRLDRKALREIIFEQPEEKRWLESLLHPLIGREIERRLDRVESAYAMLESPLLLEGGQSRRVDRVLVIDVPESVQIERTRARDGSSEAQVRAIMDSQLPRSERLARADDVIRNDGDPAALRQHVATLHERYLELARDRCRNAN